MAVATLHPSQCQRLSSAHRRTDWRAYNTTKEARALE